MLTGVSFSDGGGAGKVTGAGSHGLALIKAIEGVRCVGKNGVGKKAEPI